MVASIELNRGSDLPFEVFWPSAPGSTVGMDLTGYTVDAIEVHPALEGRLTLTITDAANGEISGYISWHDDMPSGPEMSFILRITIEGKPDTLPRIEVVVL